MISNNIIFISNNGNIGIDTENPTSKLHVNGSVRATNIVYNNMSYMPIGAIIIWCGDSTNVPMGWALCNGVNNTPNLQDKFIIGASSTKLVNSSGGQTMLTLKLSDIPHTHTSTTSLAGSHNHGGRTNIDGNHIHRQNIGNTNDQNFSGGEVPPADSPNENRSGSYQINSTNSAHKHAIGTEASHSHSFQTTTNGGVNNVAEPILFTPPFYVLSYIIKL
jgi:hypothetical protein